MQRIVSCVKRIKNLVTSFTQYLSAGNILFIATRALGCNVVVLYFTIYIAFVGKWAAKLNLIITNIIECGVRCNCFRK